MEGDNFEQIRVRVAKNLTLEIIAEHGLSSVHLNNPIDKNTLRFIALPDPTDVGIEEHLGKFNNQAYYIASKLYESKVEQLNREC